MAFGRSTDDFVFAKTSRTSPLNFVELSNMTSTLLRTLLRTLETLLRTQGLHSSICNIAWARGHGGTAVILSNLGFIFGFQNSTSRPFQVHHLGPGGLGPPPGSGHQMFGMTTPIHTKERKSQKQVDVSPVVAELISILVEKALHLRACATRTNRLQRR